MRINTTGSKSPSQTWHIAVGEHTGHLEHPDALAVQVHVVRSGASECIELDIVEQGTERRILMGELEAEALARVFARMAGADGQRIAAALLDSAHMARQDQGQESTRTAL
jgi:hypothetical protein